MNRLISGVLLLIGILFLIESCHNEQRIVNFTHFNFRVDDKYNLVEDSLSVKLINGMDTLCIQEGWNQEWKFKYDILYWAYQHDTIGFTKSPLIETDSIPEKYYGHNVSYQQTGTLFERKAYPDGSGFTDIHMENKLTNWSIRIYGKNLSQETIQVAQQIASSVVYEDDAPVEILSVKMDDCQGPGIEIVGQDSLTGKHIHERYSKMTIKPQMNGKLLINLESQYPCCTVRTIRMSVQEDEIHFIDEQVSDSRLEYRIDKGIHFLIRECRCTCTYCHNLIIDGIVNATKYQYFFNEAALLPVKSKDSQTLNFQVADQK